MKKQIAVFMMAVFMITGAVACKEKPESNVGLANPWMQSDHEGVLAATGFDFGVYVESIWME